MDTPVPVVVQQFYFAIAYEGTERVSKLLKDINKVFFDPDEKSGISPALFCFWASQQSIEKICRKLKELYPDATIPDANNKSDEEVKDALQQVVDSFANKPTTLREILYNMDTANQNSDHFVQETYSAALTCIQNSEHDVLKTLANQLSHLLSATPNETQFTTPTVLKKTLEIEQRQLLPSGGWKARALEQRIDRYPQPIHEQRYHTLKAR